MSGRAYLASEDSALLRKALQDFTGGSVLEIGAGNGGNMLELSKRFGLVVGTDLVRPAMTDWRNAHTDYVLAEGASCLRASVFDLVAFNPPYLAVGVVDDPTTEGGRNLEVPKAFLREALKTVKGGGRAVFLLNNDADPEEFGLICAENGFEMKPIRSERVFFEELTVYSATPKPQSHSLPALRKRIPVKQTHPLQGAECSRANAR